MTFSNGRCDFTSYKPLQVGSSEGKSIRRAVEPEYPNEAKKRRIQGLVNVRVLSNAEGVVEKACAISGPRILRKASEAAALKTLFEPVLLNGEKVRYVECQISFDFVLPKQQSRSLGQSLLSTTQVLNDLTRHPANPPPIAAAGG